MAFTSTRTASPSGTRKEGRTFGTTITTTDGGSHGIGSTEKEQVNADLLAFITS